MKNWRQAPNTGQLFGRSTSHWLGMLR